MPEGGRWREGLGGWGGSRSAASGGRGLLVAVEDVLDLVGHLLGGVVDLVGGPIGLALALEVVIAGQFPSVSLVLPAKSVTKGAVDSGIELLAWTLVRRESSGRMSDSRPASEIPRRGQNFFGGVWV